MTVVDDVATRVALLLRSRDRVLVAIDGPDAAGKTTFADALAASIDAPVARASIDGFHNPREVRLQRGSLSPEGYYLDSFDYDSLAERLLDPFADGCPTVSAQTYDWRVEDAADPGVIAVPATAVLVLDGVFLLRSGLRDRWTTSVYLHVAPEETLRRASVRDLADFGSLDEVVRRYTQRYLPGQALYRDDADPVAVADVGIDNTDPLAPIVVPRA